MAFTSLAFIFHFLPIFLLVYYIIKPRYRNVVLLMGSLVFYACGNPYYLLLLAISVLVNYFYANRIYTLNEYSKQNGTDTKAARTVWLISALIFNIGLLFAFKYVPFCISIINTIWNLKLGAPVLGLPLGISFYTFQMISFVMDINRAKYNERIRFIDYATYATMFPQITSGPITRYSDISRELISYRYVSLSGLERGITYFAIGMGYKVLIADKIAALWNDIWRVGALGIDAATAWLGAWGYSFEIYFDFAGYSLMAIGVASMLGFTLPTNFDEPYSTKSMTSFWRKWHITLGAWFRDYLYIPMGGNRVGTFRLVINLFVVWVLTGIWHGASYNFLIWGLFLFVIMVLEKYLLYRRLESSKVLGHIYMFILIPVSWTIFNISNPSELYTYLCRMFMIPIQGTVDAGFQKFLDLISTYWWMLIICIVFATPYPMRFINRYKKSILLKIALLAVLWFSIYQLAISVSNPFIYFAF